MQKRYYSDTLDLDARNCKGIRAIHLIHLSVPANPLTYALDGSGKESTVRPEARICLRVTVSAPQFYSRPIHSDRARIVFTLDYAHNGFSNNLMFHFLSYLAEHCTSISLINLL